MGEVQAADTAGFERGYWRGRGSLLAPVRVVDSPLLFERFLYGLALADGEGRILYLNRKARQLLMPHDHSARGLGWTCCDLICERLGPLIGGACLTRLALQAEGETPEVRMDIDVDRLQAAAWVTAFPVDSDEPRVLFHLRPGRTGDRRRRVSDRLSPAAPGSADLQIQTFGDFQAEGAQGPLDSEWLEQRPGQLFKYLVCERRRTVTSDRIAEALWPEAGVDDGKNRLRHYVHVLREKLEPERANRSPARFVVARRGGYVFETQGVWIDTDEFEREARAGLAAHAQGCEGAASLHLADALRVYRGPFLSEDPYVDWALEERERLGELAARVLRAQAQICIASGRLDAAADHVRRLADMEPFDTDVQKLFLEVCLRRGRRSEAFRRYSFFRKRMLDAFGHEPDFALAEMEHELSHPSS
ncbi:MAG TPA: BTAD domain-containing putative transcriptional regulator [Solirubrobacterales bacterium]|nr:BTAD domain-containing putative transcriptional regulator [Solirubrobacterales bacterium]